MKCTRVEKFLPLYVAGDLAGRRERAVENHLTACEKCRLAAVAYRASRELFHAAALSPDFDGAFYEELRSSVLAQITRDRQRAAPRRRFFTLFDARLAYAASLVLFFIAAALALHSYTRGASEEGARQQQQQLIADANRERTATPAAINIRPSAQPGDDKRPTPRPSQESARRAPLNVPRAAAKSPLPAARLKIESAHNEARPGLPSTGHAPSHVKRNPHAPVVGAMPSAHTAAEIAATRAGVGTSAPPEVSRIEMQTSDPNIRIIWLSPETEAPARPLK
jgi:hypothetical protein